MSLAYLFLVCMAPAYQKAIAMADQILAENYVISPPTDPAEIAKNYGIQVLEVDFGQEKFQEVAGFIDVEKNQIFVNKQDVFPRQRFTIAHELGHFFLHKEQMKENPDIAILFRRPLGQLNEIPIEKEANCFAAHLLVPSELLTKSISEGIKADEEISRLAQLFQVSKDVIGFRLQNVL